MVCLWAESRGNDLPGLPSDPYGAAGDAAPSRPTAILRQFLAMLRVQHLPATCSLQWILPGVPCEAPELDSSTEELRPGTQAIPDSPFNGLRTPVAE